MGSFINLSHDAVLHAYPRTPLCIPPESTIRDAMQSMKEAQRGCILICRGPSLEGIFTERDVLRLMANGADFDQPVETVMQRNVVCLNHNESVREAISRMYEGGYRRLPVLNDAGEPIGIVTVKTLLRYLVEHFPSLVYTLPPDPHYVTQGREGA